MAKDKIHYAVRNALKNDGWKITKDPLTLKSRGVRLMVDLEASKFLLAEKENETIAIEIKSFRNLYVLDDFYSALGQYLCYRLFLDKLGRFTKLYLAITNVTHNRLIKSPLIVDAIQELDIKFITIKG
ncbi:MAG: element excision factor XisH family protein [Bacteroidota bacterium]